MRDGKHNDNWVDLYKAALLEEDQEKQLKRTDVAADALRNRIWVLVQELRISATQRTVGSGKALHDALRALEAITPLAHPSKNQQSIRVIREEVDRIEWALKEILPQRRYLA